MAASPEEALLDPNERKVLDLVAEYQFAHPQPAHITDVVLAYPPEHEHLARMVVAGLGAKGYLERVPGGSQDVIQLTPVGLLICTRGGEAAEIAERTLNYLKRRVMVERSAFTQTTWDDLKKAGVAATDADLQMVVTVMLILRLCRGGSWGGTSGTWGVPADIVELRRISDIRGLRERAERIHAEEQRQRQQWLASTFRTTTTRAPDVSSLIIQPMNASQPEPSHTAEMAIDFAILTAIVVERKAVCTAFGLGDRDRVKKDGRWYWRGRLPLLNGESYEIVVAQPVDMGNVEAALLASDVIRHWNPGAALLVGIAATTDPGKVNIGDVVVGKSVWYYEHGKVTSQGTKPEPEMISADSVLLQHFTGMADWDGVVPVERPDGPSEHANVHFGVIASGEKVIAAAAVRNEIASGHRKILAIEMRATASAEPSGRASSGCATWTSAGSVIAATRPRMTGGTGMPRQ